MQHGFWQRVRNVLTVASSVALLYGCAGTSGEHHSPAEALADAARVAPMDHDGTATGAWDYLRAKYDADGNARIDLEEYDRPRETFERLDRDGDGTLSAADFEDEGAVSMSEMHALVTMLLYFDRTEPAALLTKDEVRESFAACDRDGNGAIDRGEFTAHASTRDANLSKEARVFATVLDGVDPWDSLVEKVGPATEGTVSQAELVAFFEARDEGTGVWDFRGPGDDADEASMSGPSPGTPAPDFVLSPLDSGKPVRLSSFRGKRPVALVFGSYT